MANTDRIFLGLGSNCGECSRLMRDALVLLEERGVVAVRRSSLYEAEPVLGEWQRGDEVRQNFLNAVVEVETDLSAGELLDVCMKVEKLLGRVREGDRLSDGSVSGVVERWSARTMDIDILMYGREVIGWKNGLKLDLIRVVDLMVRDPLELVVPHPRMHERNFVLVPFAEIASEIVHPVLGLSVVELLRRLGDEAWVRVSRERW